MEAPTPTSLFILLFLLLAHRIPSSLSQINQFLSPHNLARSPLGLPNLSWDPKVALYAQSYAASKRNNQTCRQLSPSHGPYGENLFWGGPGKFWTPEEAVNLWVSARRFYDHASNRCLNGQQCGQYTQIVWRKTTALGCASVVCSDNSTFIICSYNPPGNIIGQSPY